MSGQIKTIGPFSFERTDMADFVAELNAVDPTKAWVNLAQICTDKGLYIIHFWPKVWDGHPVRFDAAEGGR